MEVLFKIFLAYGWWGLLGIIVCIGLFFTGKFFLKRISSNVSTGLEQVGKTLTNEITKQNQTLVETMISQQDKLLDHLLNKEEQKQTNHNNMLEKRIELSEEISNAIKEIGLTHNSHRVFILEFHNSYQNLSGTPFAKYSCTYEWFEKGAEPILFKCKDLPFSSLSHVVNDIFKNKKQQVIYDDMKKFEECCPSLMMFFKDKETTCIVYTAMYDKNNTLVGLLVLEYQNDRYKTVNYDQLHIQAAELTSILNLRYKYLK